MKRSLTDPGLVENMKRVRAVYVDRELPPAVKVTKTIAQNHTSKIHCLVCKACG